MLFYLAAKIILMEKSSNKPVDLSVTFAVEILNLVKYLKEQKENIISNQFGNRESPLSETRSEPIRAHSFALDEALNPPY